MNRAARSPDARSDGFDGKNIECPMELLFVKQTEARRQHWRQRPELGWQTAALTVAFGSCETIEVHSGVTVAEAQAAVTRAMETWNRLDLPLQMKIVDATLPADILVEWKFAGDDSDNFLGATVQAHSDFPPPHTLFGGPPLPLHFNADFLWGIEAPGCFDIETIALHEWGHLLGLIFHSGIDTIMYSALREAPFFVRHQIDAETVARIRQLYWAK